ncbi:MAG: response regulator transcription factor [Faecalibacterium sp.]|nr:response regulator transcription factor [Ruminococcus sp.]MCM1391831.1 response regulator transcription factor [Ruminococcus sp.]MCM1485477.1 response regulator transcription factor [Faecalibacterium sp.]
MKNVLVCDDDKAIVDSLKIYLKAEGYNVVCAYNGEEAVEQVAKLDFHCIIMDIMMPVMDGILATVKIRENSNVPIIFLSAKGEDMDKIAGLGFGADDYVTKPFNPLEVMARVKSQIRRYISLGSLNVRDSVITTGGLSVDTQSRKVTVDGEEIRLTATEYKIVEYLMLNLGRTLSSAQIYEKVWNEDAMSSDKTVTVHIRRIREKIEIDTKNPMYIKVVWGIGYKIEKI